MNQKKDSIKNLIDAHSWLGLIISILLFLVFWAGAVSLFRAEIASWAELPHHPVSRSGEDLPLQTIIEGKLAEHTLNTEEHLTVIFPSEETPYYKVFIDLLPEDGYEGEEQVARLKVDPKTGETISDSAQFYLADFIYSLHYSLNIPSVGMYLIGFVTLFFLFAIFSGIFIHAKKLFANLFLYRKEKTRTKLLDIHNVVGVLSLPFMLMYAITGLVFNLSIIFQVAFALVFYQGDQDALVKDAGFTLVTAQPQTGKALDMSAAFSLIEETETTYGVKPLVARFFNYGDENALLRVTAVDRKKFGEYFEIYYRVNDGTVIHRAGIESSNVHREGRLVIARLHYGDFAGVDLRILYFVLAIAVAAMILAGNILWVNKRATQKNVSSRVTAFVANLTTGACSGFVVATAIGFLVERIMPVAWGNRADLLVGIYCSALLIVTVAAFWSNGNKSFIGRMLFVTAAVLLTTVMADWLMFSDGMLALLRNGVWSVVGVEAGLVVFSGFCIWAGQLLLRDQTETVAVFDGIGEAS